MASFVKNMIWNSVSGFVEEGKRTVGGYAGDALIKAGDMVEGGGRSVGNGIEKKAIGLGTSIGGTPKKPTAKPLPSTARRPAAHRSTSLPANTKPASGSGIPLGAKKTPAVAAAAKRQTNGVSSTAKATSGSLPKFTPKALPASTTTGLQKGTNATKALSKAASASTNNLPKPYPNNISAGANNLPKPYPSSEKKTAVRPGQSKPFTPPPPTQEEKKAAEKKKPYPGTNTLPGQGSKTPVKKYKPLPRYEPPVKSGEAKSFF